MEIKKFKNLNIILIIKEFILLAFFFIYNNYIVVLMLYFFIFFRILLNFCLNYNVIYNLDALDNSEEKAKTFYYFEVSTSYISLAFITINKYDLLSSFLVVLVLHLSATNNRVIQQIRLILFSIYIIFNNFIFFEINLLIFSLFFYYNILPNFFYLFFIKFLTVKQKGFFFLIFKSLSLLRTSLRGKFLYFIILYILLYSPIFFLGKESIFGMLIINFFLFSLILTETIYIYIINNIYINC